MRKNRDKFSTLVFLILGWIVLYAEESRGQLAESGQPPKDMAYSPGGEVRIGANDGLENEQPQFTTYLHPYFLDKAPVTVAQFRLFVKLNHYLTDAEKKGESLVFLGPTDSVRRVKGANWQYPQGPDSGKAASQDPVRHISWNDALAYANWVGKRLPNEYELEIAGKQRDRLEIGGLNGRLWEWCDNWYAPYRQDTYYQLQLNREKSLKGGPVSENTAFRPTQRKSALPTFSSSRSGFRCALDVQ